MAINMVCDAGGLLLVLKGNFVWLESPVETRDEEAVDLEKVRADRAVQLLQRALRGVSSQPCCEHWRLRHRRVQGVHS